LFISSGGKGGVREGGELLGLSLLISVSVAPSHHCQDEDPTVPSAEHAPI